MSRKKILIAVIVLILVSVVVIISSIRKNSSKLTSPLQPVSFPTGSLSEEEPLGTYEDPAGFSFKYPQSLTVSAVPNEDETIYSWLKISSSKQEGKIVIKAQDTNLTSFEDWLSKSKEAVGAGPSRDVALGDISAKQIQFSQDKKLMTVAVDEGILYLIEGPLDEAGFWNRAQNTIASNFTFLNAQQESGGQSQSVGQEAIYEEEEVIE